MLGGRGVCVRCEVGRPTDDFAIHLILGVSASAFFFLSFPWPGTCSMFEGRGRMDHVCVFLLFVFPVSGMANCKILSFLIFCYVFPLIFVCRCPSR